MKIEHWTRSWSHRLAQLTWSVASVPRIIVSQCRSGNTKIRKWKGIESYQDARLISGHGWWVDSILSIELQRIIQCSIEWYYRCVYLKVLVIFVLMSFSATYPHQSTSLLWNFPMLNHVQTLHNIESSNTPSYKSETSMYMSSAPSQNASSIFSSDSGLSYNLQMNYHPFHHLGPHCDRHQILITKFLVLTFFAIFYVTSFLQGSTYQFSQMTLISWGIHYTSMVSHLSIWH